MVTEIVHSPFYNRGITLNQDGVYFLPTGRLFVKGVEQHTYQLGTNQEACDILEKSTIQAAEERYNTNPTGSKTDFIEATRRAVRDRCSQMRESHIVKPSRKLCTVIRTSASSYPRNRVYSDRYVIPHKGSFRILPLIIGAGIAGIVGGIIGYLIASNSESTAPQQKDQINYTQKMEEYGRQLRDKLLAEATVMNQYQNTITYIENAAVFLESRLMVRNVIRFVKTYKRLPADLLMYLDVNLTKYAYDNHRVIDCKMKDEFLLVKLETLATEQIPIYSVHQIKGIAPHIPFSTTATLNTYIGPSYMYNNCTYVCERCFFDLQPGETLELTFRPPTCNTRPWSSLFQITGTTDHYTQPNVDYVSGTIRLISCDPETQIIEVEQEKMSYRCPNSLVIAENLRLSVYNKSKTSIKGRQIPIYVHPKQPNALLPIDNEASFKHPSVADPFVLPSPCKPDPPPPPPQKKGFFERLKDLFFRFSDYLPVIITIVVAIALLPILCTLLRSLKSATTA